MDVQSTKQEGAEVRAKEKISLAFKFYELEYNKAAKGELDVYYEVVNESLFNSVFGVPTSIEEKREIDDRLAGVMLQQLKVRIFSEIGRGNVGSDDELNDLLSDPTTINEGNESVYLDSATGVQVVKTDVKEAKFEDDFDGYELEDVPEGNREYKR